mgnify:CR=1 FL=1
MDKTISLLEKMALLCLMLATTLPVRGAWFDNDWQFRKPVTINSAPVAANLTDFPLLVVITDPQLNQARADGFDLVFTAADGSTRLEHEIERFQAGSGELIAWVRIPLLSATNDSTIWLYYGNPASANQQNAVSVWSNGYRMIQHLNENAGAGNFLLDSTSNNNHGAPLGNTPTFVEARIDGGYDVSGNNQQRIEIPDSASLRVNGQLTAEGWALVRSNQPAANPPLNSAAPVNPIIWKGVRIGWGTQYLFRIAVRDPTQMTWGISCGGLEAWFSAGTPQFDQWAHYALTFDGAVIRAFINGVEVGSRNSCNGVNLNVMDGLPVRAGFGFRQFNDQQTHLDGILDELRISATARSSNWLQTQVNNHSNPQSFISVGEEETGEPLILVSRTVNPASSDPNSIVEHTLQFEGSQGLARSITIEESLGRFNRFVDDAFGPGVHFQLEDDAVMPAGVTLGDQRFSTDGINFQPIPGPPGWADDLTHWQVDIIGDMPIGSRFTLRYQSRISDIP